MWSDVASGTGRQVNLVILGRLEESRYWNRRLESFLEEEKGNEPCYRCVCCWNCTRQEIRMFLEEVIISEQFGEPFRWSCERTADQRAKLRKVVNNIVKFTMTKSHSSARRPWDGLVSIYLKKDQLQRSGQTKKCNLPVQCSSSLSALPQY